VAGKGSASVAVKVISNRLPAAAADVATIGSTEVARAGFEIEAAAKALAPVRTGLLRRSIHTVLSNGGNTATVGPSVDYGLYVEMGSRGRSARPFMRPAAEVVMPKYLDRLKFSLRKVGR